MSPDTDYAHKDIHLSFVLEFEYKIVKQYRCFSVTPWQVLWNFLSFLQWMRLLKITCLGFLNQMTVFVITPYTW